MRTTESLRGIKMQNLYLLGNENVKQAGYDMKDAANLMAQAASAIDESLRLHRQWMDEWISRFEIIMARERGGKSEAERG